MKHRISGILALLVLTALSLGAAPKYATTIDFLDYVFYDTKDGNMEYYPLEVYEQRLRELAEGGISKVYLRVNVCGLVLYPTKFSAIYGQDGLLHWDGDLALAKRLVNTLARYDVCKETIRLGHKYGMEVWAWDSLWDESAYPFSRAKCPKKCLDVFDRNDGIPLLDPWFRSHPEGFSMLDPRKFLAPERLAAVNREARKYPVARIVIANVPGGDSRRPMRVEADDVLILVSNDNRVYKPYDGKFEVKSGRDKAGLNFLEIKGLRISAPYIKVAHRSYFNGDFALVLREPRNQCKVYNTAGKLVPSVWAGAYDKRALEDGRFRFGQFDPFAWDYEDYQAACLVGEVNPQQYFLGVTEFAVPAAAQHKLDRFVELADYPFDGFMWNTRSHSCLMGFEPDEYGFNPEVRSAFQKRYGVDIWREKFDLAKLYELRAEAIADFFKRCKEKSGGRPVWLSGLPPVPGAYDTTQIPHMNRYFLKFPWLYKRYFADGSIDGVVMYGKGFIDHFTEEVTGGKPVKIGYFREMAKSCQPRGYDFKLDMQTLKADPRVAEVELYEALILTKNPEMFKELK